MNDFVEAVHILAGPKKSGRKNPAHPPVAFVWGHDSEPKEMEAMVNMALQTDAAAVSLQFSGKPRLDGGPTQVVVEFTDAPRHSIAYPRCEFGMADANPAMLLVSSGIDPKHGHFAIVGGQRQHRAGWPLANLDSGFRRAASCLCEMVAAIRTAKGRCGTTMYELRFAD